MPVHQPFKGLLGVKVNAPIFLAHQQGLVHQFEADEIDTAYIPIEGFLQTPPLQERIVTTMRIMEPDIVVSQVVPVANHGHAVPKTVEGQALVGDTEGDFPINIDVQKVTAVLQEINQEMITEGRGKVFTWGSLHLS